MSILEKVIVGLVVINVILTIVTLVKLDKNSPPEHYANVSKPYVSTTVDQVSMPDSFLRQACGVETDAHGSRWVCPPKMCEIVQNSMGAPVMRCQTNSSSSETSMFSQPVFDSSTTLSGPVHPFHGSSAILAQPVFDSATALSTPVHYSK